MSARLRRLDHVWLGWIGLLSMTALAFALRRYRVAAHGLWFDEADLIARARLPLADLLAAFGRPGENGPLYTLLMAVWLKLAALAGLGDGELIVRLPSLLAGTLAVPVLILLGRALGGWAIGLSAGLLLAVSPYAVWYSQDAKMYALLTLLGPASWLLLWWALGRPRWWLWLAYGLLSAGAFAIHVTSLLVWASQTVVVALAWRRLGAARHAWAATTVALLLPLLGLVGWQLRSLVSDERIDVWHPSVTLGELLAVMAVKLAVNRADGTLELLGAVVFALLALVGLVAWHGRRAAVGESPLRPALLLGLALLLPVGLFFLITLRVPLFQDRYLISLLPPYLLLIAGALVWPLGRGATALLTPVALAGLLWLAWVPLRDVVFTAESTKEDWRSVYRFIDDHAREGDIVIVHPGYLRTTADYYQRRFPALARLPLVTLPSLGTADFGERELDSRLAEPVANGGTAGKTRVWLVTSPDRLTESDRLLQRWYEGNTLRFADRLFNGIRLQTFSYNGPFKAGQWRPELPLRVDFGDEISLVGATWDLDAQHTVRRGGWALLTLRWRPLQPPRAAYTVRVRLRAASGAEVAAYDIEPLDGHFPTTRWHPRDHTQIWDYHDLLIPLDLPPGVYSVAVGLSPAGQVGGALLPTSDATPGAPSTTSVGTLTIVP